MMPKTICNDILFLFLPFGSQVALLILTMQKTLLMCLIRAVVTTQERDLEVIMGDFPKSSTESAVAAKMSSIMRKAVEANTEGILMPLLKSLVSRVL